MNTEQEAIDFYKSLAESADNKDMRQVFNQFAQEESKHKLRFELEYDEYIVSENRSIWVRVN